MNTQRFFLNLLYSTCIVFFCIGCGGKTGENKSKYWLIAEKKALILEQYDSMGRIISRKWLNTDTVANGAEILYHPNKKIKKWKWYGSDNTIPYAVVYYDTNGKYRAYEGITFIRALRFNKKDMCIAMINPPNVKFLLGFRDSLGNKLVDKSFYKPTLTDSVAWVNLGEVNFKAGHIYTLTYYFVDDKYKILDSFYQRLR